jgi:hypothetical protein
MFSPVQVRGRPYTRGIIRAVAETSTLDCPIPNDHMLVPVWKAVFTNIRNCCDEFGEIKET